MNIVILEGRLTKDPDYKTTQSAVGVCNISIATDESYKKDGQKVDKTEFHNVVYFGPVAEVVNRNFKKGDGIKVQGKLETQSYEKDGQKRYSTKVVANYFGFPSCRRSDNPAPKQSSAFDDDPFA